MNKAVTVVLSILALIISAAAVMFDSTAYAFYEARDIYRVYLNGESLGIIESKKEFEEYINDKQEEIKKKYNVDKVYSPNGLKIEKETTYNEKLSSVEEIYNKIANEEDFTIDGYTITIVDVKETKNEKDEKKTEHIKEYLYALDKNILTDAVNDVVKSFVDEKQYEDYLNETKKDQTALGTIIENVYIKEQISVKKERIPANKKIYQTEQDLARYLLFGTNEKSKTYKVKTGDNVKTIAESNKMSSEEFLIANQNITDENALLYEGQEVVISYINPVITIVEDTHVVKNESIRFKTIEQKDSSMFVGTSKVTQKGKTGESKITRKIEKQNGKITQALITESEVLSEPINKIVKVGTKQYSSSSGSTSVYSGPVNVSGDWGWPTVSRYTITTYFGYQLRSDIGESSARWHDGMDIAGLGCGTPIYAANGGTVITAGWYGGYGNTVRINHGNGIITLYGHLNSMYVSNGQTVEKGQRIGAMGNTGYSFGCHLHYGLSVNGNLANPLSLY